ncbi:MAG: hypothetical protein IAE67_01390 [Candidatus Competibacteraceae bacterium]|nr:hypothetical protein [Candidatus Competibacteraceae bacterium]
MKRNKNLLAKIIFALLLVFAAPSFTPIFAQSDSHSPYSFYGIGVPQRNALQNGFGMGGIFAGLRDSNTINFLNPASYSAIDVTQFIFGAENNVYNRSLNNINILDYNVFINQVGLGVPIMRKKWVGWGLYVGYSPYSQVGYTFADSVTQYFGTDTVLVKRRYDGSGGVNQVTLGNGFRIYKYISIGLNVHYLFGTIDRNRSLLMPLNQAYLSSRVQEKTRIQEVGFDVGLQSHFSIKTKHRFRPKEMTKDSLIQRSLWPYKTSRLFINMGINYSMGRDLSASLDKYGIQFLYGNTEYGVDTFDLAPGINGAITLPHIITAGIHLTNAKWWSAAFDFNWGNWSSFSYFDQPNVLFSNTWGISAGAEFDPPYKNKNLGKNQFLKNMLFRAGARYQDRAFRPDTNPVDEVGISFGLGLPLAFGNKYYSEAESRRILSYINIGVEGGWAASRNNGTINESFFRLNLGVTIRDKWFIKRRFN